MFFCLSVCSRIINISTVSTKKGVRHVRMARGCYVPSPNAKRRHPCPCHQYLLIKILKISKYKLCLSLSAPRLTLIHKHPHSLPKLLEHMRTFCSCLSKINIWAFFVKTAGETTYVPGVIIFPIGTLKMSNRKACLSLSLSLASTPDWKHIYRQYVY